MDINTLNTQELQLLGQLNAKAVAIVNLETALKERNLMVSEDVLYAMNLDQLNEVSTFLN
jgi:hypothetical protein